MATPTMVTLARSGTASDVGLAVHHFEVARVLTGSIPAEVVKLETDRDQAVCQLVPETMRLA
jgi:hypothetical protein